MIVDTPVKMNVYFVMPNPMSEWILYNISAFGKVQQVPQGYAFNKHFRLITLLAWKGKLWMDVH
jgi:hypothetical protein